MTRIHTVTTAQCVRNLYEKHDSGVVVKVYSPTCPACVKVEHTYQEIANRLAPFKQVVFAKAKAESSKHFIDLTDGLVPGFLVYNKKGKLIAQFENRPQELEYRLLELF